MLGIGRDLERGTIPLPQQEQKKKQILDKQFMLESFFTVKCMKFIREVEVLKSKS